MALERLCPTCNKRPVIVDDGCAVCLFFRSDEEQNRFSQTIQTLFEQEPDTLTLEREDQIFKVIASLPYICTYKAQYMRELRSFVGAVLDEIIEEHTIDVVEDEKVETQRWVA